MSVTLDADGKMTGGSNRWHNRGTDGRGEPSYHEKECPLFHDIKSRFPAPTNPAIADQLASTLLGRSSIHVSTESERFRMRAKQCRELAAVARDAHSRQTLSQMAAELDAEADQIEADEDPQIPLPPVDL